jgi:acyl carrier protein phosphodiesterase
MNYLAHLLLAGPSTEAQVGGLLGDFTKSSSVLTHGAVIHREIAIHRAIDSYTDAHPVVLAAKARFRPATRRYAGILLDLFYDHVLADHWDEYSDVALPDFIARFHADLDRYAHVFPERFAAMAPRMVAEDWLGSYASFEGVEVAVRRVSWRLSKGRDAMIEGLEDLRREYTPFADGFARFYPQLAAFAASERARLDAARVDIAAADRAD